jgi:hypothetical protein
MRVRPQHACPAAWSTTSFTAQHWGVLGASDETAGDEVVSRAHADALPMRPKSHAHIARSGAVVLAQPHRTTPEPAVNRSTEPAICVSSATSAYVPIWRAWKAPTADVLCARSVRGGRAQIGSSVGDRQEGLVASCRTVGPQDVDNQAGMVAGVHTGDRLVEREFR